MSQYDFFATSLFWSSSAHLLSPDYKLVDEALDMELLNSGASVNTRGNQI
jgi:hypothetical protein